MIFSHYCLVRGQYRDRTHLVQRGISQMQCSEGLSLALQKIIQFKILFYEDFLRISSVQGNCSTICATPAVPLNTAVPINIDTF